MHLDSRICGVFTEALICVSRNLLIVSYVTKIMKSVLYIHNIVAYWKKKGLFEHYNNVTYFCNGFKRLQALCIIGIYICKVVVAICFSRLWHRHKTKNCELRSKYEWTMYHEISNYWFLLLAFFVIYLYACIKKINKKIWIFWHKIFKINSTF